MSELRWRETERGGREKRRGNKSPHRHRRFRRHVSRRRARPSRCDHDGALVFVDHFLEGVLDLFPLVGDDSVDRGPAVFFCFSGFFFGGGVNFLYRHHHLQLSPPSLPLCYSRRLYRLLEEAQDRRAAEVLVQPPGGPVRDGEHAEDAGVADGVTAAAAAGQRRRRLRRRVRLLLCFFFFLPRRRWRCCASVASHFCCSLTTKKASARVLLSSDLERRTCSARD